MLGADERPLTGHDEVTSVDRSLVLSSTAVHLGEHGSIHDLAESEIYRWANVRGYVALHRTQPIYLSENRCMMHLRLTGVRLGMEQVVVYTRLSGGMARVDRLWHPLSERENRRRVCRHSRCFNSFIISAICLFTKNLFISCPLYAIILSYM